MACGTPVLAEANPMMEELMSGVNGALWRGEPEGLAQAIVELLQKPDQLKRLGLQTKSNSNPLMFKNTARSIREASAKSNQIASNKNIIRNKVKHTNQFWQRSREIRTAKSKTPMLKHNKKPRAKTLSI